MLKVFNSLTRKLEIFSPISKDHINFYLCGPTVYDYIHIGNARSLAAFDTIKRYLTYLGYSVTDITNITDIDDKIILRANEVGMTYKELANKFEKQYLEDISKINIKKTSYKPNATDFINEMIDFIQELINLEYAYICESEVIFDTSKSINYGKLSNKNLTQLIENKSNRLSNNSKKRNPSDFTLWKPAKENEPYWSSPWGNDRPGWHIECSTMIKSILKEAPTLDIHAGGSDL